MAEIVHACPEDDSGFTACCERTPFELAPNSRMTIHPALVTCRGSAPPLRSHPQRIADDLAALDYAETALDEAWAVLKRIRDGVSDPQRIAGDLLDAHGVAS